MKLVVRRGLIESAREPRPLECSGAENIGSIPIECMPVAHRHAQMLFHGFAADDAILVVITIGQRIPGLRTFKCDAGNVGKV